MSTIRLADNREYKYSYDEIGRPRFITYPDGTNSEKRYQPGDSSIMTESPFAVRGADSIMVLDENKDSDGDGHGFRYHYDLYGNLLATIRGDMNLYYTKFYYDGNNALTKYVVPGYYETIFENDLLGRRKSKRQPNGDIEYFQYDNNSNLTKHINYEGKNIDFSYDGLNRVTNETYQDSQYNVGYTYDSGINALGRLTLVTDKSGSTQFKYNNLGLITEENKNLSGTNYVTKYIYDNTGLLLSIEYPTIHGQNIKVDYEYDTLDRIDKVKLSTGGASTTIIDNTYDNVGRLTDRVYGNGLRETYSYDLKDRLIEHDVKKSDNSLVFNNKYTYDKAGNIIQRDISDDNVIRRRDSYEYDYIYQLKTVDVPGNKDLVFDYDRHFNRTRMQHGFGVITYNIDYQMNYLTEYKEDTNGDGAYELSVQYDYSKQGNPKYKAFKDVGRSNAEISRETYSWNDRDELVGITGRVTNNFVYDYKGLRVKTDKAQYVYLQNDQPALKYNTAGNYYDVFIYEGTKRVMRVKIDSMSAATKEYFINDYQGSPVAVVAEDQSIKYQNYQDPWGNSEMEIGIPSANPEFKYTDKELDEDSGVYYFQQRYYDSIAGRFIGRDKVKLEDEGKQYFQLNPFQFCLNNPVKHSDDDGMLPYNKTVQKSVSLYNNFGDRWRKNIYDKKGIFVKQLVSKTEQTSAGWFKSFHSGTDIAANKGTPVYSAADGVIYSAGVVSGYGNTVVIKHFKDDGSYFWSFYAHMDEMKNFNVGDKVLEGQRVGSVGGSGTDANDKIKLNMYPVHLHIGFTKGIEDKNNVFHFSWNKDSQFNPETKNIGKYNFLEQTPAYKQGLSK